MFTFTSEDELTLHVHEWQPDAPPQGVVQIAHGMGEHAARYTPLAHALTVQNYVVYADDHRGHGLTMHAGPGVLGDNGWNLLVEDLAALTHIARERHPALPVILLGHSLGSFATQQYLVDHAPLINGAVLCGTTAVDELLQFLVRNGGDMMTAFNAPFQPARTDADWLSRDEAQVDAYIADPLCGFTLDEQAMSELAAAATEKLATPRGIPTDLPLYVMVGDHDPVNQNLTLSDLAVKRYRRAGLTNLTYRIYPGARHELFNETNHNTITAELTAWIKQVTGAAQ